MTGPRPDEIEARTSATGQRISQEVLDAIGEAPPSLESYAPLKTPEVEVSETKLRQITLALVNGTPMPRLTTVAEKAARDRLEQEIKELQAAGLGVELPFGSAGEE